MCIKVCLNKIYVNIAVKQLFSFYLRKLLSGQNQTLFTLYFWVKSKTCCKIKKLLSVQSACQIKCPECPSYGTSSVKAHPVKSTISVQDCSIQSTSSIQKWPIKSTRSVEECPIYNTAKVRGVQYTALVVTRSVQYKVPVVYRNVQYTGLSNIQHQQCT